MATRINYEAFNVSKAVLEARCRLNSPDLVKLGIEATEQGVDIYEVVSALVRKWRVFRKSVGDDEDLDSIRLETELKSEKLLNERIKNQTRLGVLIPKVEAQNRMLRLLNKYRELLQEFIRVVASDRVSTSPVEIKPTVRSWVEYLTGTFNKLIKLNKDDTLTIRNWEDDGSYRLLRTRLLSAESEADIDRILLDQASLMGVEDE